MMKVLMLTAILVLILSAHAFARPTEIDPWESAALAESGVVAADAGGAGTTEIEAQGDESAQGGVDEEFNAMQGPRDRAL